MFKKIIIICILSLISIYLPLNSVRADITFSSIEVYGLINGKATLRWATNENTRAEIWYGLDQNNLDRFMGYSVYDRWHETVLTGLEKDETYYYKIKAISSSGEVTETFIRMFSTDDMEDTIRPEFKDGYPRIMQTTHNAVAFKWATDEKTKAEIYYGSDPEDLSKEANYNKYHIWHTKFIYDLNPNTRYYFKFKIIDKDENYREKTINLTTHSTGSSDLEIYDIEPLSPNSNLIQPRQIILKWKTNLISKNVVYYGTDPDKLKEREYTPSPRKLKNELVIDDLDPNKTYYFEIKAYDSLYNKSKRTDTLSFKTKKISDSFKVGDLVQGSDSKVYIIQKNGTKAHIKNEKTFLGLKYKWSMIKNISDEDLNNYVSINSIKDTDVHPEGSLIKYSGEPTIYLIDDDQKRPFFTAEAFIRRGYLWEDIITISKSEKYDTGDFIF